MVVFCHFQLEILGKKIPRKHFKRRKNYSQVFIMKISDNLIVEGENVDAPVFGPSTNLNFNNIASFLFIIKGSPAI